MSNFRNRQSAEILGSVYKNAEMAYEASGEVLKHCANRKLAGEISAQRDRYRDVAAQARTEIVRRGGVPREYSGYAEDDVPHGYRDENGEQPQQQEHRKPDDTRNHDGHNRYAACGQLFPGSGEPHTQRRTGSSPP